jgi:copper chaperone
LFGRGARDLKSARPPFLIQQKMASLELDVDGMMCGGCENSVQKVVSGIPGVVEVKADHKSKKVVVVGDVDKEVVAQAITDAGYTVGPM